MSETRWQIYPRMEFQTAPAVFACHFARGPNARAGLRWTIVQEGVVLRHAGWELRRGDLAVRGGSEIKAETALGRLPPLRQPQRPSGRRALAPCGAPRAAACRRSEGDRGGGGGELPKVGGFV